MTESVKEEGTSEEAVLRAKLRNGIAALMQAIDRAKADHPGCVIKLMIAAEEPDGRGHIAARMDNAEFISDVATLVGYVEPTNEEKAQFFLGSMGLKF